MAHRRVVDPEFLTYLLQPESPFHNSLIAIPRPDPIVPFTAPPQSSAWKIYTISGELVDQFKVDGANGHFWKPSQVASGLYLVRVEVTYQNGSTVEKVFKVVVLH